MVHTVDNGPCHVDIVLQSVKTEGVQRRMLTPFRSADGKADSHGCRKDEGRPVNVLGVIYGEKLRDGEIIVVPDGQPQFVSRHRIRHTGKTDRDGANKHVDFLRL